MKKTKINFGAILLIIYAVIATVLSNISSYISVYNTDMYLSLVNLNNIIGVGSVASTVMFVAVIAFSIVLLCGKRWGSLAMGAAMTTLSLVNVIPMMSIIGEIIFNDFTLLAIAIPVLFVNFITVPAALSWFMYALAGLFATIANNKGKRSITAMILKVLSAPGVVIAGLNQILFPILMLAIADTAITLSDVVYIILVFGLVVFVSQVSLLILAAGMILSVRCKPDCKAEKKCTKDKAEENMPEGIEEFEIAAKPEIDEDFEEENADIAMAAVEAEITEEAVAEA